MQNENTNLINRGGRYSNDNGGGGPQNQSTRLLYQIKENGNSLMRSVGSRRDPTRPSAVVNNLMGGGGGGQELVLAVGNPNTLDLSKPNNKQFSMRNSLVQQQHSGNLMNRSWTRPQGSAGYPLDLPYAGHLPTLGLIKRRGGPNVDIMNGEEFETMLPPRNKRPSVIASKRDKEIANPFSRESNTENLLIARQKEREARELSKGDNEGLRVFEKGIATRQNRSGVIREINSIKANKKYLSSLLTLEGGSGGQQQQLLQLDDPQVKKKLNIFDQQDANTLKNETLAKLGYQSDDSPRQIQEYNGRDEDDEDGVSHSSNSSLAALGADSKPKAIEYLQKGREQKESVKEFVLNSRKILTSQIAINDKNEETERLKEYIIMEKEKLEQAKKTFAEDSDKFHKYKKDLRDTTKDVKDEYDRAVNEKNGCMTEIKRLEQEIISDDLKIKKIDDYLQQCWGYRAFIHEMAISAGRKSKDAAAVQNKQGNSPQRSSQQTIKGKKKKSNAGGLKKQSVGSSGQQDGFFLTQAQQQQNTRKHRKNSEFPGDDFGEQEDDGDGFGDQTLDFDDGGEDDDEEDYEEGGAYMNETEEQQALRLLPHLRGVDLNIKQYFDPPETLLEYMVSLEEDNLFKIHLVQEDEDTLDNLRRTIEENVLAKEKEINDVRKNIEMLERSKQALLSKQHFLESNMKSKHGGQAAAAGGSKSKAVLAQHSVTNNASEGHASGGGYHLDEKSALAMLQQYTGCSIDLVHQLSNKIVHILEKVLGISHEDKSNRIEMLRKIEGELQFLVEKRDYVAKLPKLNVKQQDIGTADAPPNLAKIELHQDGLRKQKRREKQAEKDAALMKEKEEKNEAKKLKQLNFVIFKGRPEMERAKKKNLKPKKKSDDKPSEEVLDQIRYLGQRITDGNTTTQLVEATHVSTVTTTQH